MCLSFVMKRLSVSSSRSRPALSVPNGSLSLRHLLHDRRRDPGSLLVNNENRDARE